MLAMRWGICGGCGLSDRRGYPFPRTLVLSSCFREPCIFTMTAYCKRIGDALSIRSYSAVKLSHVGWLVILMIYVALAIFQPYRDLETGDNQSLRS